MTLAYFASRSRLDPEASLAAAADAAGGDRNHSWGTPGTSQSSAYLRGAGFSAAASLTQKHPCYVITLMHDHRVPNVKPFMHMLWNPSM